ncbi:MAG TPA: hypothetical protein VIP11_13875 [Gemmatimonadaceae bacterium]
MPTFANKVAMANNPGVKLPDLKTVPLVASKQTDGPSVERVTDARTRRQVYEVTIAAKMRRGGAGSAPEEFDTESIKKKFLEQDIGANALGKDEADDERFVDLAEEWMVKSLIWVCAIEKGRLGVTFYSHVGRPYKFHHSSFTSGGALVAAGEWIVENGSLRKISGNSGHYRPTIAELHRAVLCMSPAWQSDTEVMVYNKQANNWEYVPVNLFKVDPSGGGKYAAHAAQA